MTTRTAERAEFLQGVFNTACEGGVNYWAAVIEYNIEAHTAILVDHTAMPEGTLDPVYATGRQLVEHVAELYAEGKLPMRWVYPIDIETIARGLGVLRRGAVEGVHDMLRLRLLKLDRNRDAGELDADDADVIVQAALFGKIVYG